MAEDKKTDPPKTDPPKGEGPITMGGLRTLVGEVVKELLPGGPPKETDPPNTPPGGPPAGGSVKAMVQTELDKIKAREARDKRDKDVDDQLAKLAPLTAQKTPVERGRLHRFMGWGDND